MWQNYICETDRTLAVWLCEHTHKLNEGPVEKYKLSQHAYEGDHRVMWDEPRILDIESNSRKRKCKESAHMVCLKNPISQPFPYGSPLSSMR
jgi:hypothetical protein